MNNTPVTELLNNAAVLFVFALESEAAEAFGDCDLLFTGIGKVNAAFHLTRRILQQKPALIVNLGSAGSNVFKRGDVVCCTQFVQRDMDVTGLGFRKYETPLSGQEPLLEYGLKLHGLPEAICGTGDSFEMAHDCPDYNVLDMEAYPLAWIARQENIPFLCLKYISDGADGMAAEHWTDQVRYAAVALRKIIDRL